MREHQHSRVEDYTAICLIMALVNLMWIMFVIWAWQGFVAALLLSAAIYHSINLLDRRLARRRS
ncbi:hypothetical protein [Halocynthiibacter sp.]|uniref:hypothetical protein n=1 Tax=Halocynthiibacter sp. TaxID=1979210 RepID=UPI003C38B74E